MVVMTSQTPSRSSSIENAYAEAEARYIAANPLSREAYEKATSSLPGGNTRSVLHWAPYPLCIDSAEGYTLRDVDGHAYVDLLGEFSAGLYGHSDPSLLAALAETARGGLSYGGPHTAEARLAALVTDRFPGVESVRFTNSGTEANLLAIAAAKAFTRRPSGKVLVFEGAYHGSVLAFPFGCAGGFRGGDGGGDGKFGGLRALNAPHDFLVATYNDVQSVDALIDSAASEGDGIAAILLEPMLGSGGGVCATPAFMSHLRRRAHEVGALLILDEVMTSRMFDGSGMQDELGVRADLVTLGKYLGGGASFGAFGGRGDVMALFDPRRGTSALPHAGTFNNNVLSMKMGLVGLERVFTRKKARELHVLGEDVRRKLEAVVQESLGDGTGGSRRSLRVLGCGSILVLHFTKKSVDEIASPADWVEDGDPRLLDLFHLEMLNEGFYLARRGYMALSLALLEEGRSGWLELDRFVHAVSMFLIRFRNLIKA
ncbi:class III aminotransferase [Xylaria sp. CBS 124048]|nr:class III aminotransferase [Xylaria sp. CBS 124048]